MIKRWTIWARFSRCCSNLNSSFKSRPAHLFWKKRHKKNKKARKRTTPISNRLISISILLRPNPRKTRFFPACKRKTRQERTNRIVAVSNTSKVHLQLPHAKFKTSMSWRMSRWMWTTKLTVWTRGKMPFTRPSNICGKDQVKCNRKKRLKQLIWRD